MNLFKKVFCAVLCIVLLLNFAACSGDEDKKPSNQVATSMTKGEPSISESEKFTLPEGNFGAEGAPIIIGATRKVEAGDTVLAVGEGFSAKGIKAYVYAKDENGKEKAYECKYQTVKDNEIAIVTDKNMKYGVFAVYVTTDKGNSNIVLVNEPKIHWIGTTSVTKDDTISIYGENLTYADTDNTRVFFSADGEYCTPEIIEKNPYKITVKIPDFLEEEKEYEVSLHSGLGGEYGFAKAEEKIKFVKQKVNDFSKGKIINVTEYGANPADDGKEDTEGIKAAMDAANDGDTIYFPNGTYLMDGTINSSTALRFKGESKKGTVIVAGDSRPDNLFNLNGAYIEVCNLAFHDVKESGKLKTTFIYYRGSNDLLDYCEINVHDCYFYQESAQDTQTTTPCIAFIETSNAIYENNETLATVAIWTNDVKKMFHRNNTIYGNMWTSTEYNQNSNIFWRSNMCDVSNNTVMASDALKDDTHILDENDRVAGRSFTFQGFMKNLYIAENKLVAVGTPNTNGGEQILLEAGFFDFQKAENITANSVTFNKDFKFTCGSAWARRLAPGDVVVVTHGKGAGQYRTITALKDKTITIDRPWDIMPDKDSMIGVSIGGQNIFIYKNDISGYKNYAEDPGATCGVSTSGSTFNLNIIDNKFSDMPVGIFMSHKYKTTTGNMPITMVQYFSNISGNLVENTCKAIRYELYYTIPQPNMEGEEIYLNIGSSFRRNTIKNTVDYTDYRKGLGGMAVNLGTQPHLLGNQATPTWVGDWLYGIVFENNSFENSVDNIRLCKHQGNTILRNNKVDKGQLFKVDPNGGQPIMFND